MKILFIVITIITFCVFMIEGLIHYNSGYSKCKNVVNVENHFKIKLFSNFEIDIPEEKEILFMSINILIFSSIVGLLNAYIIKHHLNY